MDSTTESSKNQSIAIGIDLGTTFSAAAVYQKGHVKMIPNLGEGHYLTPSFIFYDPNTLDVSVGDNAEDDSLKNIQNFLFDMKRIIGREFEDAYVQNMIHSENYKFQLVKGENDKCEIELKHGKSVTRKSPEQACSEILTFLKKSAEEFLGVEVTDVVISIPAYFNNAQRKATKVAAQLAQLNVLKLVTEPVAASIHYCFDKIDKKATLLVFDWGGGTLDVSIIEVDNQSFVVKDVEGDTFLGGRDFDELLVEHFKIQLVEKFGDIVLKDQRLTKRLTDFCKRIKIKLSTSVQCSLVMDTILGSDKDFTLSLTRTEFEEMGKDLFTRALDIVDLAIINSDILKENIDEILLVGGTTKIPKIREMLSKSFNNKKLKTDVNPDEAVAHGAALQAAILQHYGKELERFSPTEETSGTKRKTLRNQEDLEKLKKYKITDVTPLSVGESLFKERMDVYIKKNKPLPAKSSRHVGCTVYNNQKVVSFVVCEGERKNCKYNNILGEFQIDNLPPGKAGQIKFEKYFELDEDGILTVTVRETTTGNSEKIILKVGEYRLCESDVKKVVNDAEENKKEDEKFIEFVDYLSIKRDKCNNILYDVENFPIMYRKSIKETCIAFLEACDIYEYEYFEEFKEAYKKFEADIRLKIINFNQY